VKFTATDAMIARLREAQELLSHSVPSGDMAEIFDQALIALLEKAKRRKYSATTKPGRARPLAQVSRDVPAAVEREVWARDGGGCAFVGRNGRRCAERRFVEFHHVKPWAASGQPTAEQHRASLPRAQRVRGVRVLRPHPRGSSEQGGGDSFRNESVTSP